MSGHFNPKTILITGATGSIGRALAEVYAEPGVALILQGRNSTILSEIALSCKALGASVKTCVLDLRELEAYRSWLEETCSNQELDLVFVNAGVNTNIGPTGEGEHWDSVQELIAVNVLAAMATVDRILPSMRAKNSGQIALISSLAAYYGLPVTPSYCASKAAIKTYGEALRGWLAPEGIWINVVMPGYVDSKMCREMPGPKPFLWTSARAAAYIKKELALNRPRISFPFPLNLGTWLLSVLPSAVAERLLRLFHYSG